MSKATNLHRILFSGVVAIMRAPSGEKLVDVAEALAERYIKIVRETREVDQ